MLAQEIAIGSDVHLSNQTRGLLASEFRALWHYQELRGTLVDTARALNEQRPWLEGWRAVREIKHYDYRKVAGRMVPDGAESLDELDDMLKPERIPDEVRAYVLSSGHQYFALDEEFDSNDTSDNAQKRRESSKRAAARAYDLGTVVAGEPQDIDELTQELFTARNGYLVEFGRGMATTFSDLRALWDRLIRGLELAGDQAVHCDVLCGVIEAIHQRDEPLAQTILDEAVQNSTLRKFIVHLQLGVPPGHAGVDRLHRSLDFEETPLRQFEYLAWHRPLDKFSETDIRDLMLRVLDRPNGAEMVLEGLSMRIHVLRDDNRILGTDLKELGLRASAGLLRHVAGYYDGNSAYYNLSVVLASCLDEIEFPEETGKVFDMYFRCLNAWGGQVHGIEPVAAVLAEKATFRFLDGVFFYPRIEDAHRHGVFEEQHDEKNLLSGVRVETLLDWCRQSDNSQERLGIISGAIYPFEKEHDGDGIALSKQALAIIGETQDPSKVLRNLGCYASHPSGGWGSLADIIAKRCQAFETLLKHERSDVREAAAAQIAEIKRREEQERRVEQAIYQRREQSFE